MKPDNFQMLIEQEGLPPSYASTAARWWRPLATQIAAVARKAGQGILVGINGSQGSGKSTMSLFLQNILRDEFGLNVAILSLDDLYLTQQTRSRLAAEVHPLLATRGVPGTHDVELGKKVIHEALWGSGSLALPRFDKATDDRAAHEIWPTIVAPLDVLLFEGWCVNAQAVPEQRLRSPINLLERLNDAGGQWRTYVNTQLAGPYRDLFQQIDLNIMLRAPNFDQVVTWRQLQERKLVQRTGMGMDGATVIHFMMHYERLTRQMLEDQPAQTDIVFDIGVDHMPIQVTGLDPSPPGASLPG